MPRERERLGLYDWIIKILFIRGTIVLKVPNVFTRIKQTFDLS